MSKPFEMTQAEGAAFIEAMASVGKRIVSMDENADADAMGYTLRDALVDDGIAARHGVDADAIVEKYMGVTQIAEVFLLSREHGSHVHMRPWLGATLEETTLAMDVRAYLIEMFGSKATEAQLAAEELGLIAEPDAYAGVADLIKLTDVYVWSEEANEAIFNDMETFADALPNASVYPRSFQLWMSAGGPIRYAAESLEYLSLAELIVGDSNVLGRGRLFQATGPLSDFCVDLRNGPPMLASMRPLDVGVPIQHDATAEFYARVSFLANETERVEEVSLPRPERRRYQRRGEKVPKIFIVR